jgi:hypothetical protein
LNLLRSTLDTAEIQRNITNVFHILGCGADNGGDWLEGTCLGLCLRLDPDHLSI